MQRDTLKRSARRLALAGLPLLGLVAAVGTPRVVAQENCATEEIELGIVKAAGCFSERTPPGEAPVYEATSKFRMNGFDVTPDQGAKVVFSPADGNKRGPSVATANGFVTLDAANPTFGPVSFRTMSFAFSPPPSGEMILTESALAQPGPVMVGLLPLGVKQPIRLTEEGAEFDVSFDLNALFVRMVTGKGGEQAASFTLTYAVKDGAWALEGGGGKIEDFELASLVDVEDAELEIGATKIDANLTAALRGVGAGGFTGGFTFQDHALSRASLGLVNANFPVGPSGLFLQKFAVDVFTAPPFGGRGTLGLTVGREIEFFGRKVTAVAIDGSVEVRGADLAHNQPGYFKAAGDISVVTIPLSNASFAYYFGQGTQMSATIGIGLPSLTNDPGQPTYIGGALNGWTSAQHFDLESSARLKLLGIDLAGAQTVVSDVGLAGCAQVIAWIGGGIRWSDGRGEVLGGWTCDLGGYRPQRSKAKIAAGGAAAVSLGEDHRVVRISAAQDEDAPQATLTHPDGRVLATPDPDDEDGIVRTDDGATISGEEETSHFVIDDDASGNWRLEPLEGSSDIEAIEVAKDLPDHEVRARVIGHGRRRTLRWRAQDIPHQRLQFSERLPDGREVPIFETGAASGERRFLPVEGPGTHHAPRRLAVDVIQRLNTPRDELIAGRYLVKRRPAPERIRGLRVERRLEDLVVRWKRSSGARSYRVIAHAVGAATYTKEVAGKRHRARLFVGTTERMRVRVIPINVQDRRGRAASQAIDTEALVANRRVAARHLVEDAVVAGGRIVAHPACPDSGHCAVTLRVASDGSTIGSARASLPPDMTDRLVVALPRSVRNALRREEGGAVTLTGRIAQLEGSTAHRATLPSGLG